MPNGPGKTQKKNRKRLSNQENKRRTQKKGAGCARSFFQRTSKGKSAHQKKKIKGRKHRKPKSSPLERAEPSKRIEKKQVEKGKNDESPKLAGSGEGRLDPQKDFPGLRSPFK